MIQHNKRILHPGKHFATPIGLYLCVLAEETFNQILLGILALGVVIVSLPYALLVYDAREDVAVYVERLSSDLGTNIASLAADRSNAGAFVIRPHALSFNGGGEPEPIERSPANFVMADDFTSPSLQEETKKKCNSDFLPTRVRCAR